MSLASMHPEDVKAELRKRFGSVAAFERAFRLPEKSVTDLLRGRTSGRVSGAVESVIERPLSDFPLSDDSDNSRSGNSAHLKNKGIK
jgi:hypothetical protein